MRNKNIFIVLFISVILNSVFQAQDKYNLNIRSSIKSDTVSLLIDYLNLLSSASSHSFMSPHCRAIIDIIQSRNLTDYEISFLKKIYSTFTDTTSQWNASQISSYLERKRPFIISWKSTADNVQSLAWMIPPKDWDITKTYPLYVSLHGLYQPYANPIEYMARYLSPETILEKSFDDGYSIYPWGRGNLWYEGIGATDVWESIEAVGKLVKIDSARRYLVGHSMGGYGAWVIGQNLSDYWAAIGVYAGALWYNGGMYLNSDAAEKLKDVPVYIVCGTQDGLLSNNQRAYDLLVESGNSNVEFTTFPGGHESTFENWENMFHWIRNFSNEKITSSGSKNITPELQLLINYPNPFNPATTIIYKTPADLPAGEVFVSLKIYNTLGIEIITLVNKTQRSGIHQVKFDSRYINGKQISGGIYLCRLQLKDNSGKLFYDIVKKMVLLK